MLAYCAEAQQRPLTLCACVTAVLPQQASEGEEEEVVQVPATPACRRLKQKGLGFKSQPGPQGESEARGHSSEDQVNNSTQLCKANHHPGQVTLSVQHRTPLQGQLMLGATGLEPSAPQAVVPVPHGEHRHSGPGAG